MTVRETVDARKTKFGEGELESLLGDAQEIVIAKGKKALTFSSADADWSEIESIALGRSGNLRAPTVKVGKRALVGFSAEVWDAFFA